MRTERAGRARQASMLGARRRHGRWAARAQARGALERAGALQQAGPACVGAGARAAGALAAGARTAGSGARGMRSRGAAGARPGRWARGLGAWVGQDCALGAPDLIFKLVFDSVFFLS